MEDIFKPTGALKSSKTDAGGGVTRPEPVLAVVKNNVDPTRSGRIQVYVQDIGANDPDDSKNWVTVSYLSPFFGVTPSSGGETGYGSYLQNPASYGVWNSAPDLGTTVVCLFINGDMNYGYYIGCVPTPESLHMVPAIGSSSGKVILNEGEAQSYGGAPKLPVTNINSNNKSIADGVGFLTEPKPVHSYAASIYAQQGLLRDPIRGPISSSAQRETPSRVGYGVSTPGRPIYEGGYTDAEVTSKLGAATETNLKLAGRRSGHSFVMDDGDINGSDQLIRLRTALGHQILMSDDGQTLFIIHSNGQSYIELGKEGTIDMYSTNSVNVRTQGDLNLHADNNININAAKNLNIAAGEDITMSAEKSFKIKSGADFNQYAMGKYTVKVNGAMSMAAAGQASYASSAETFINGSRVNLNTGSAGTVPAVVAPLPVIAHTDTLYDATKGYAAAPGKLLSIVSRAPAHAPWANANQGVDVKVSTSASAALPQSPSAAVAAANNAVPPTPNTPVTTSTAATVPDAGSIGNALDKNATSTLVGAAAKNAASGVTATAVAAGAGVITNAQGKPQAIIGKTGLTPEQMETAGDLKPGSAKLINSLVEGGKTVQQAMTPNMFTGKSGAENLTSFTNNTQAQVKSTVAVFQKAQTGLINSNVITGKEAPGTIAGLVMAGANAGIAATANFVKNAANATTAGLTNMFNNKGSDVAGSISSGNFAANMSQTVTSGLSSIAGALSGVGDKAASGLSGLLDSAKGVAGSAFAAVTKSFKPMKAGEPQDLTAIAKANAESEAASDSTGIVSSATSLVKDAAGSVSALASKAVNTVTAAATSVKNSAVAAVSTGLGAIPGGQKAIASVVNNTPGATNSVPGLGAIGDFAKNQSTAITNGVSTALTKGATGLLAAGTNALKNQSLSSLATAGLPPALASQLNASINSLSAGGPIPIKLPTVAIGTNDRSEITTQFGSVLNKKIPTPNFDGDASAIVASVERQQAQNKKQQEYLDQQKEQAKVVAESLTAYKTARDTLPQGDPSIQAALDKYNESYAKYDEIGKKIRDIVNEA